MYFRFVNCVRSRCYYYYNENSAKNKNKNRYEIFQHASLIARQNIPKCFLSPRTTLNICKVQESKSPIKLTSKKRKLNFLDHAKED